MKIHNKYNKWFEVILAQPHMCTLLASAELFNSLHGMSHPGIRATQRLVNSRYVWPSMNLDVRRWARSCPRCQRSKIHRHSTTPLAHPTSVSTEYSLVHCLHPMGVSTFWHVLIVLHDGPVPDSTADTVARAFIKFPVSGFRHLIVAGNSCHTYGQRLHSCLEPNTQHITNDLVERFHQQMKAALKASLTSGQTCCHWCCYSFEGRHGVWTGLWKLACDCPSCPLVDPASYVTQLTNTMRALWGVPARQSTQSRIDSALHFTSHLY